MSLSSKNIKYEGLSTKSLFFDWLFANLEFGSWILGHMIVFMFSDIIPSNPYSFSLYYNIFKDKLKKFAFKKKREFIINSNSFACMSFSLPFYLHAINFSPFEGKPMLLGISIAQQLAP